MDAFLTSRHKNRLEISQPIKRASQITLEEWNLYLVKIIRRFQKRQYDDFFELVKNWIIADKHISLEQYEFIYSTPLIEILKAYLTDFNINYKKAEVLKNILQIVTNLTTSEAPDISAFLDETLLQNFASFLSHENPEVIKFILIILSQIFDRQPTMLEYFESIQLKEKLTSTFLTATEGISGVSCFFLCQFVFMDNTTSELIFPILFEFALNGNPHSISTLFKSFLYFTQKSPDFLNTLISCDFCSLCAQFLANPNDSSEFIKIAISIFMILKITALIDAQPIRDSNIIPIIAEFKYFDSSQNTQLLGTVMDLLSVLIQKGDPTIDQQLVENNIFQTCSELVTTAPYNASLDYLLFICNSFQRKDASICELCMTTNIISRVFDIFDTIDNSTAVLAIKSIIDLLTTKPDLKPLLLENDFDAMMDNASQRKEPELDGLVQLLFSMTEEE